MMVVKTLFANLMHSFFKTLNTFSLPKTHFALWYTYYYD